MIENRQVLINIHSDDLVQGQPKLPTASQLEYGEIAVSYAKSAETLSIRNSEDEIVTFSCDDKFNESFRVMSKAMCDLDDRVLALEELSAITIGDLVKTDAELGNVTTSGKVVDALLVKDINNQVDNIEASAGTFDTRIANLETSATSIDTRVTNLETSAGTLDTRLSNLEASAITTDDIINTEEAFSALTASGKVVDAKLIRDIIYDNEEVTSQALNNINDKIVELSGATPSIETTLAVSGNSAITVTVGEETSNALVVPYAVSASTVANTVTTEAELSALTQTGSYVDAKLIRDIIYDNEETTASALNDLNDKIIEISGATPELNMVETESQLSSLTASGYVVDALLIKDINNDVNGLESSASTFSTNIQTISATTVDLQSQIGDIETILQSINGN